MKDKVKLPPKHIVKIYFDEKPTNNSNLNRERGKKKREEKIKKKKRGGKIVTERNCSTRSILPSSTERGKEQ